MKTTAKIAGLLLMILLVSGVTLNAQRGMRGNGIRPNSLRTREFRSDIAPGQMAHHGQFGDQRNIHESLPNVTEKQKKDMADLQLKQQDEMKKLREETSAKMQSLRDSHKKAMENLLTDEQKKFLESKQVKAAAAPAPAK